MTTSEIEGRGRGAGVDGGRDEAEIGTEGGGGAERGIAGEASRRVGVPEAKALTLLGCWNCIAFTGNGSCAFKV